MNFAILGAGAIGAYVGAALSRGGADVVLVARGGHLRAMQEEGVRVLSPRGDFHARPRATSEIEACADADVVFIGLKAYSLTEVAPQLGHVLRPGAAVIAAQNGIPWWYFQTGGSDGEVTGVPPHLRDLVLESVDPGGVIAEALEPERVIGCVVYCSTEIVEPGLIRHVEGTRFALGEPDGTESDRCLEISAAFRAGGLKAPVDPRLREQIFLKLLGNASFNPVTALTGATLGELGGTPAMVALLRTMMEECAAVAERLEIEIPVSIERRLEKGIEVGDHKTSMLQDREAGKRLEYECMTGAIVELADRLGIPVPHTRAVHACVELVDVLNTRERTPTA